MLLKYQLNVVLDNAYKAAHAAMEDVIRCAMMLVSAKQLKSVLAEHKHPLRSFYIPR
jgi:hypothetical protein